MSSYCSLDEARSAGATGNDAEVTAAIEEASERVERYTGDVFEPTPMTLQVDVDGEGIAWLRRRIRLITSVTWLGAPEPVATSAYRVDSSVVVGGRDTIAMYGDLSWADVTVLGAEPWNGGWANLARRQTIVVVGVFGWDAPPAGVRRATAMIAAKLRDDDVLTDSASSGGTTADAEGNVLPVVPPFMSGDTTQAAVEQAVEQLGRVRSRTTGVVAADVELASYVREPVRFR
jgi:hypothetical protein